jgi:hypothetical protein
VLNLKRHALTLLNEVLKEKNLPLIEKPTP